MKFAVALLLGTASVQAVDRKNTQRNVANNQMHQRLDKLDNELKTLHKEYNDLAKDADLLEGQPVSVVQRKHKNGHRQVKKFAEGMKWGDKLNQSIRLKDTGKGGRLLPVKLNQNAHSMSQFDLAGKTGSPALPSEPYANEPHYYPRGEKRWQNWAQNFNDWGDYRNEIANTRQPYASTLAQQEFDLAGKKGSPGLPAEPYANEPHYYPRGEKRWQNWAQNFNDWGEWRTDVANERQPYASTLIGTEFDLAGKKGPGLPDAPAGNKPLATGAVRGEKQWQGWAQDFVDYGDYQTDNANSRIPYASTLVQTEFDLAANKGPGLPDAPAGNKPLAAGAVRGEKEWQTWAQDFVNWEDSQTDTANSRIPYQSTLLQTDFSLAGDKGPGLPDAPAGNAPLTTGAVRGEKEWQAWAQDFVDWEDIRTDAANARIPYQSTLIQTGDDLDMETMEERLPVSTALMQTHYDIANQQGVDMVDHILMSEDRADPSQVSRIETMAVEDVPLDQRLIFIQNEMGDQAIRLA